MKNLFQKLNYEIAEENKERKESGAPKIQHAQINIMGQYCLLLNAKIQADLDLVLTNDVDAILEADYFVKKRFAEILKENGLELDPDSSFVWIPPKAKFEDIYQGENLTVSILDAESALLSKAIKAPEKNRFLIIEALLSKKFKNLSDKIKKEGGDINYFLETKNE